MLVGNFQGDRVEAIDAYKGLNYTCPSCRSALVLKQGRKVIHHFAHKAESCSWSVGETTAHLKAKTLFAEALRARGHQVHVEYVLPGLDGDDRRADVFVRSENAKLAIEIQHTNIPVENIERRAASYARMGIIQIWLPVLPDIWKKVRHNGEKRIVDRYAARPFERWVHGFSGGRGMWVWDPFHCLIWHAQLKDCILEREESTWYETGGVEVSAGGYEYVSKRWKKLILTNPMVCVNATITALARGPFQTSRYRWPAAEIGIISRRETA